MTNNPADQPDRAIHELGLAQVEARIRRLTYLLGVNDPPVAVTVNSATPPLGATLVLDFGNGPQAYRFAALDIDDGRDVVTPDSPLGRALAHASPGQRVTYRTAHGEASVTLVAVRAPAAA